MMTRLKRKARAIDDHLYSSSNQVTVKEELEQYSDLFKLLSTHHEEHCELLGLEDQSNEVVWFDNLNQDVFNCKHKIHRWLRDSVDKSSSKPSSRGSFRIKKSSGSTKSSSNFKPFTKMNLLEEKTKIAELESEATFLLEKQKTENKAKIL